MNIVALTQTCTCSESQQRCSKKTMCVAGIRSGLATDSVRLHASALCTCKRWSGTQLCRLPAVAAGSNLCGNLHSLTSYCCAMYLLMPLSSLCCNIARPLVSVQPHSKHSSSCHCISAHLFDVSSCINKCWLTAIWQLVSLYSRCEKNTGFACVQLWATALCILLHPVCVC